MGLIAIAKEKLVKPEQVPNFLIERRVRLFGKMLNDATPSGILRNEALPSAPYRIPDERKRVALKVMFKGKELSPFFHENVRMVGGLAGETLSLDVANQLAVLQKEKWGAKDGNEKKVVEYMAELVEKSGPAPIFVYFENGRVEGAVFPVQAENGNVTSWQNTVDSDSYKGDTVACPKICSYGNVGGVAKALITEGVLPYATALSYFRLAFDLIAYSRPADYGEEKRGTGILEHLPTDPNWAKFHFRNDGKLICVVENAVSRLDENAGGYGFIVGYARHLLPDERMLSALQAVEKNIAWLKD